MRIVTSKYEGDINVLMMSVRSNLVFVNHYFSSFSVSLNSKMSDNAIFFQFLK